MRMEQPGDGATATQEAVSKAAHPTLVHCESVALP